MSTIKRTNFPKQEISKKRGLILKQEQDLSVITGL